MVLLAGPAPGVMINMDFLAYWNLKQKPFENTGDPRFFYYSPYHKEALVRLIYVIKQNKAGALLAGDYGTGKTTIANELIAEVEESHVYQSVYISNPILSSREILEEIAYQLGIKQCSGTRLTIRRAIEEKLLSILSDKRHTIILIDEAHLITRKDVLEELRLLMNLQKNNRFLATMIMMGQLELRDTINAMPQFKQRFALCYNLKTLERHDTEGYIKHRLMIAGANEGIFAEDSYSLIHASAKGRPRQINNICDMSLLVASMKDVRSIGQDVVRDVIKDLGEEI